MVYLGVRAVGVAVLAVMSARVGSDVVRELTTWDGAWLLALAEHGYAGLPPDHLDAFGNRTELTPLGFFPGYPALVSIVSWLTFGSFEAAGLLVSLGSGVAAAYALTRIGELVPGGSRRAGLLLAGLFAATPMAVVLSMSYTEALFSALAAWALVGVLRRQWLPAGAFAAAAGLVRPTATAVVAAVGLAALVAVVADVRAGRPGWRPWAGGLLAATGLLGYLGYVAVRTGRVDGWFAIQREGWGWYFDGGDATAEYLGSVLVGGERVFDVLTLVAFVASLVLLGLVAWLRLPWPLLVYGAVALLTVWGTEGLMNAKLRLLVPAFALLVPVALGLARRRTGTAVAVLGAAALGSAWFGGYALTIWAYGI
ncbi:hypothetical protein KDL28_20275 [Pseudonocardia sp. S2-4]|uniref:Dolichyl-phosphate-mannose-protein mannosyltransferase n=1 Tax=Pseudonocardia humida TaxID=2800819 RepID=A0ABT1A331_9PSEU|nr:hypothetical protein [Pseudonocardia humida]